LIFFELLSDEGLDSVSNLEKITNCKMIEYSKRKNPRRKEKTKGGKGKNENLNENLASSE
jgi:hypothetical protein